MAAYGTIPKIVTAFQSIIYALIFNQTSQEMGVFVKNIWCEYFLFSFIFETGVIFQTWRI